jgi:MFS family permease
MERSPPAAPPADRAGLYSRAYASRTAALASVMFLTGFAALAVVPTLPVAARELHGLPLYPLVAGCFVAAALLGGVLGGAWSDRAGPRRPLAAGLLLAVAALLLCATGDSVWQLAAGRFVDGLAAGTVAVAINTAVAHSYPDRLRPAALALMSTCWIIPSLAGPPLAGLVADRWSWRAVFFGLAALTLLSLPAVLLLLRERHPAGGPPARPARPARPEHPPERPPLATAAGVSAGAALGQYAASGWDLLHLLCALGGLALLVPLAPRLLPPGTWRAARGLPGTALLRGLASGTFFTLEAFVPLMLSTVRRVPPVQIGLAFTGAALAWAAASWLQGHPLARAPRHRLVAAGALIQVAATALAVLGTRLALPAATAAAAMVLAAFGMGLLNPALTLLSLSHSPPGRQGWASGTMQTSQNLGQTAVLGAAFALSNAALAAGSTQLGGYTAALTFLLLPGLLVALLAQRTREDSALLEARGGTSRPKAGGELRE